MSESGGDDDGGTNGNSNAGLPEYVSNCYYHYGLKVATHPIKVILFAISVFVVIW